MRIPDGGQCPVHFPKAKTAFPFLGVQLETKVTEATVGSCMYMISTNVL